MADLNKYVEQYAIVKAPDLFRGVKLVYVTRICKDHENAVEGTIVVPDPGQTSRICVSLTKPGDSIILVSELPPAS
jgi:hypothetical protein